MYVYIRIGQIEVSFLLGRERNGNRCISTITSPQECNSSLLIDLAVVPNEA